MSILDLTMFTTGSMLRRDFVYNKCKDLREYGIDASEEDILKFKIQANLLYQDGTYKVVIGRNGVISETFIDPIVK
jgi:hypothetical protein